MPVFPALADQFGYRKQELHMRQSFVKLFALSLALILGLAMHSAKAEESMLIEVASPLNMEDTYNKLKSNAKALGWKAPKKWKKNFQKNLMKVTKQDIGPAVVLEMCEPKAAVKLLQHDKYKLMLAMMPCTIAVYEKSDGKVYVSMMNMRMMSKMFPGKEVQELVDTLAPQMDDMLKFN